MLEKNITEAKAYIDSIDFSKIIYKLVNYHGWLENDAIQTCSQYRRFLFLNKKFNDKHGQLPPSEDIDEFWHSHILDTQAYVKDCQAIYGKYMHHYPYFGIGVDGTNEDDLNNAFEITQKLYLQEYGEVITATKSHYPGFIYNLLILSQKIRKFFSTKYKIFTLPEKLKESHLIKHRPDYKNERLISN